MPLDDGEVILDDLLQGATSEIAEKVRNSVAGPPPTQPEGDSNKSEEKKNDSTHTQWALGGNDRFCPVGSTVKLLPAGVYEPFNVPGMWGLEKMSVASDGIYTLPDMATEVILKEVQNFWLSEMKYRKHNLLYKRGILLWGPPGGGKCLGYNTPVLMSNGTVKMVQDINIGDLLMGDDSTPRKVLSLARGREMMYEITPVKGDSYIVNESHILSLKRHGQTSKAKKSKTDLADISVRDYLDESSTFRQRYKGYRVGVKFPEKAVTLDPYFLGLWLGDGHSNKPTITTMDSPISDFVMEIATNYGLEIRVENGHSGRASSFHITATNKAGNEKVGKNKVLTKLQELNLINNKHIPHSFLVNSEQVRLQVLAGLLDSDGYYHSGHFEITAKSDRLANDVLFLARSLGLAAYKTIAEKYCQTGGGGLYNRISISGDLDRIPTRLMRKRASPRRQIKDVLVTGITVKSIGVDNYYGFEIDGNRRFLLGDFTVTHNTVACKLLMNELVKRDGIVVIVSNVPLALLCLKAVRRIEPKRNLIVVLEDIDEIISFNGEAPVLSMLDGENNVDNILHLGTTNFPERLGARIINRPSRFDRRVYVGMPSEVARKVYLQKATAGELDDTTIDKWVKDTGGKGEYGKPGYIAGMSIAHLRELVAAVHCLDQPYEEVIDRLKKMAEQPQSDPEFKKTRSSTGLGFGQAAMHITVEEMNKASQTEASSS